MQTIKIENSLYNEIMKYGIDIQAELKNAIESGKSKLLDQETYDREMDSFVEDLKVKYGDS